MLKALIILIVKDFKMLLRAGNGLAQALFLGFLIIFLFSLVGGDIFNSGTGSYLTSPASALFSESAALPGFINGQLAAAVFWLASIFFILLMLPVLYSFEEIWQAKIGLLSANFPLRLVWLAKTITGLFFLLPAQALFLGAIFLFLGQAPINYLALSLCVTVLANIALVSLASMLSTVSGAKSGNQMLLGVLFLPLCLPLLLRLMAMGKYIFSSQKATLPLWIWQSDLLFVLAFAFIFVALAVLFFPFLYRES